MSIPCEFSSNVSSGKVFNRLLSYVPILGTRLQNFFSELFLNLGKNALNLLMNEEKTFKKTSILLL